MSSFSEDIFKLASDSLWVFLSKIFLLVFGFLIHTILVRELDPDIFGVFTLGLTIVTISSGFAVFGMGQTVARFVGGSDIEDANDYISVGMLVAIIGGILSMLIIFSFRNQFGVIFSSPDLAEILALFVILIVLRPIADVILGTVRGFEQTRWKIISNDILPYIIAFPILIYYIYHDHVIFGAILYYIARTFFRIVFMMVNLYKWNFWNYELQKPSYDTFSSSISFAWPLAFEKMVTVFLGSIDILMLGWLTVAENVGLYRSIQPVANTIIFILSSLTFIYLPIASRYFTQNKLEELDTLYKTSTRWVSHGTFPILLFYLVFGREFIRLVFTADYVVAWTPLAILSLGMYSRVIAGPNGMTIKAIDRTREDLLASIGALLTNIISNFVFIPIYGINGAALATSISYLVYNAIDLLIIYHYTGIHPFNANLFKPIILTSVIVFGVSNVFVITEISVVYMILFSFGLVVIHLISTLILTGLTPEDKILIKRIRKG